MNVFVSLFGASKERTWAETVISSRQFTASIPFTVLVDFLIFLLSTVSWDFCGTDTSKGFQLVYSIDIQEPAFHAAKTKHYIQEISPQVTIDIRARNPHEYMASLIKTTLYFVMRCTICIKPYLQSRRSCCYLFINNGADVEYIGFN